MGRGAVAVPSPHAGEGGPKGREWGTLPGIKTALTVLMLLGPLAAQAASYRVDVIVFLDTYAVQGENSVPARVPDNIDAAIDPEDTDRLAALGIRMLPATDSALETQWHRLANSQQFKPLLRLSWVQNDPPQRGGPMLHVHIGDQRQVAGADGVDTPLNEIDGSIRLNVSRYVHLDADLEYIDADNTTAYTLKEQRRMKLAEIHHLDSPKVGLLAIVNRLGSASDAPAPQ